MRWLRPRPSGETAGMRTRRPHPKPVPRSAFSGFRFPPDVIVVAVRWYPRFGLSYRDIEELLAERGVEVDHVTVYRWVLRFTPLLADAARPCRHRVGDRWQVDETYVKLAGRWRYVYRAIDQFGQVIDVFVCARRDANAARRFFEQALRTTSIAPAEVTTDRAPVYPAVLEELLPGVLASNRPVRQQPRRGRSRPTEDKAASDARAQTGPQCQGDHRRTRLGADLRRGHYELAVDDPTNRRVAVAIDELVLAIDPEPRSPFSTPWSGATQQRRPRPLLA